MKYEAFWVHRGGLVLEDFERDPQWRQFISQANFFGQVNNARFQRFPLAKFYEIEHNVDRCRDKHF